MLSLLKGWFRKKPVMVTVESYPEATKLEDAVMSYFKAGHSDLVRLAEGLGYKDQSSLYDDLRDVRVKVKMLTSGVNYDKSLSDRYNPLGLYNNNHFVEIK